MPNSYTTDQHGGMIAETININGANGDAISAYFARPPGDLPFDKLRTNGFHHLHRT